MDSNAMLLPNKYEGGRSAKDKLRDWYIDKVANNGNTIEKADDLITNVTSAAGGVALACFVPQLGVAIPAIQAGYKFLKKFIYKVGKKAIHKKLEINENDLNVKETSDILEAIPEDKLANVAKEATESIIDGGVLR